VSAVIVLALVLAVGVPAAGVQRRGAQIASPSIRPTTWSEARPIVERLVDALPRSLAEIPAAERPSHWGGWLATRRQALAARIAQGDVDSIVNLLLFGTSFTRQPRITAKLLRELDQRWKAGDKSAQETLARQYQQRATDLVAAAADPRAAERMRDVRRVLAAHGHDVTTPQGRTSSVEYLFTNVARVREEAARLAADLEAARRAADTTSAFAERSRIFRDRGLAGDSSVLTQFAVDRAICGLRDNGLLSAGPVTRAAVVGPGLDFADKQEGFDFYPPQSLQPFTLVDSLLRCNLAERSPLRPSTVLGTALSSVEGLRVTTLDISPRVNAHLRAAVARAAYRLVFPWDSEARWTDEAEAYWKRTGNRIGVPLAVDATPLLAGVRARAVTISSDIVGMIRPLEASIVSDRIDLPERERFDLVVATNVLLYYDTFEQALALDAIAAMLRPGGVLLTNDAVLEVPEIPMRSQGYMNVAFSDRQGDGERMVFYVKQ
jgi:SAM-dependent methyltransferase